jgi:hypothetical protein
MKLLPSLLLPLKLNSELNGNEERANHPNRQSTRRPLFLPAGKLGKEMGKGARFDYHPTPLKAPGADSSLLLAVSSPRLVKRYL